MRVSVKVLEFFFKSHSAYCEIFQKWSFSLNSTIVWNLVLFVICSQITYQIQKSRESFKIPDPLRKNINPVNLYNYFNRGVCLSVHAPFMRSYVRPFITIFFLLKSPWNHPLTPGVDPGYQAPPEELRRSCREAALSSYYYFIRHSRQK